MTEQMAQAANAALTPSNSDANGSQSQAVEQLAIRIWDTAPVKDARAQGLKTYLASEVATKPEGSRYAKSAVDETAMLASLYTAMGAFADPSFVWVYAVPHHWNGYTVPGARWYGDNADCFYRAVRIDDTSSYEITVYPGNTLPAQLSFMVYAWLMHDGSDPRNDAPLGALEITDDTPRNADGSITLTVGPEPANGRLTHVTLKPGAMQVLVREIRGDWSLAPVRLSVKRTDGTVPRSRTLDELANEAAMYTTQGIIAMGNFSVGFGHLAENQPGELRVRWIEETGSNAQKMTMDEPIGPDRALGFLSSFVFNLKQDEALIVTFNLLGCKYLGINTYRPFLLTPEQVYHTSSLNNYQAKANPDGSITFVFSPTDPGVYNWLDFSAIPYGEVAVRWQNLTHPVVGTLKTAAQKVKVVKLANLRQELPDSTIWVTPDERAKQRATRAEQYKLRCLGTPCEVGGELDKPY